MYADREQPTPPGDPATPQRARVAARHYRVVYVGTRKSQEEIRGCLSPFGRIRWSGVHILDANPANYFFVEVADQAMAEAICAEQHRDFSADLLAHLPPLIGIFDVLAPPDTTARKPRTKTKNRRGAPVQYAIQDTPVASTILPVVTAKRTRDDAEMGSNASSSSSAQQLPTPLPSSSRLYAPVLPSLGPADGSVKREPSLEHTASSLFWSSQRAAGSALQNSLSVPSVTPSSSFAAPLSHESGQFSCDLNALAEDPTEVIAALASTSSRSSERDKWMIVAARYRDQENLPAAIAVLSAMVQIFTSPALKLSHDHIKPTFLMLASCHMDLSRRIREVKGATSDAFALHLSKVQEYLKLVYGADVPYDSRPGARINTFSSPSEATTSLATKLARVQPASRERGGPHAMTVDEAAVTMLKRDVQSLRDRQKNITQQLATATERNGDLESKLDDEKTRRQKAESALADSAEELDGARRSAKFAVDQCKREVENRRRLEAQVAELFKELDVVKHDAGQRVREAQEKERIAREYLARVGNILGRAAQGDFDEQPVFGAGRHADMGPPPAKRARTSSVSSSSRYAYDTTSGPNSGAY